MNVPCNGCRACCIGPDWQLRLDPGDDPTLYSTVERDGGHWIVRSVMHGGCVYLLDGECSIYDERPKVCRRFDCRSVAHLPGTPERIKLAAQVLQENAA